MNSGSTAKTILFWISIVFLGVMLWKLVSANKNPAQVVSFTDFLQSIDKKAIQIAEVYLEQNSANVHALVRDSQKYVETTISTSELPDITARLRDAGAKIEISEVKSRDWTLILLNAAPLVLLVGLCLFLMRQMQASLRRVGAALPAAVRTGIGYDLHRLEEGRALIVGGIELPFDKGPVGHSDGDVLAHAMCDALLGAAGLGDIGTHFPDTDPKWKGANSLLFLEHVRKLLDEKKFVIEHVDAVVITEKPKLGPHFPKMREALAKSLGVAAEKVHLKAKTNEGVDAIGREEAIAAHVVATLVSR
ncbi:MAG TPA: 2-C-methyl-D-erythritol 2,4-cyclodiphosphate synthase [Candidatus Udaeobacter sp.]|jgi:2-C-methyl-D-erythritol 2,4-cyclodiphosphate synthase|nr:2-C-methyl-D-erythritol 2,4-cyclodiphosphate synthase [Candidatus Udaeobacter sp.]